MKKVWITLFFNLILTTILVCQQRGSITGRVMSSTGEPLPAANIIIEGTRYGTITDEQGYFSIGNLPPGEYIVVARYVGYTTEKKKVLVSAGAKTEVEFRLSITAINMGEVVVTGIGVETERRALGNTISSVESKDLQLTGALAIDRAITGKVAGAWIQQNSGMPGGSVSIRLRGTNTVLGSAEPLVVVDGIIINTDSPFLVDVGYLQSRFLDIDPNIVDRIEIVKGAAAAALYGSRANNGVIQIFTKRGIIGAPRITYSTSVEINEIPKKLEVNMYPFDKDGNPVNRYDWQDLIFRRATGTSQNLSISGGTGETRYFISTSYNGSQGLIRNTSFNRASLYAKVDQTISDIINLSVSLNYIYSKSKDLPSNGGGIYSTYYYGPLSGFIFGPNTFDPRPDPKTGTYPNPPGRIAANPIEAIDKYKFGQNLSRFIGGLNINLVPFSGLNVEYVLGYDTYLQNGTAYIPPNSTVPGLPNGYSRRGQVDFYQLNNDLNIKYTKDISPGIKSITLIGGTIQYENSSNFTATSQNLTPLAEIVPAGAQQSISEYRYERVIYGAFIQQSFSLKNNIYITGAYRVDASSSFGENNRWQFYPKLSLSYSISDENFWRNSKFLNKYIPNLKFRAAFGESGGLTAVGPYDRFTNLVSVSYDGKAGLITGTQKGTPDIKPERQREVEFGIDASFLQDRLAVELTLYNKHTKDLLLFRELSPSGGFSNKLENVGTLDNKGIELTIKAIPIDAANVKWITTLLYSSNKNEINNIPGGILILSGSWGLTAAINGQPLGVYYGRGFLRDSTGNIVYVNGIPQFDPKPKIIGNPNPKFTASFINEILIKRNLTIRLQFDAVYGNDLFNFARRIGAHPSYGVLKDYERELRGEVPKGYGAAVFRIFENWIEDGSYVKLRELSISYTFNLRGFFIRNLQVSLIGRNLLCFTKYTGYDPETTITNQATAVRGYDYVEVPIPRSYILKLTFGL